MEDAGSRDLQEGKKVELWGQSSPKKAGPVIMRAYGHGRDKRQVGLEGNVLHR